MILPLLEFCSFLTAIPNLLADTKAISEPEKKAESTKNIKMIASRAIYLNIQTKVMFHSII